MDDIVRFIVFLYGCTLGSFYNVAGLRMPVGQSIVSPPSRCNHCGHRLGVIDLIPLFGYAIRRGKCHYCCKPITPIYWFGECLTGIGFVLAHQVFGFTAELVIAILMISILAVLSVSDLKYRLLPNKIVFPSMVVVLGLRIWHHPLPFWNYVLGFLIGGGLLLLVSYAAVWMGKAPMGGGDIKLMALLGLAFGLQAILLTIFLSALLASVVGITLIAAGKISRKSFIPYGPFIALGGLFAYLYGETVVKWYLGLINMG